MATAAPFSFIPWVTLPGALPVSPQWVHPQLGGGGNIVFEIRSIGVCGLVASSITLHIVPPAAGGGLGTAGNGNKHYNAKVVAVNTTSFDSFSEGQYPLFPGYSIWAFAAAAAAVNLQILGVQY